jgi:hypothetical protein
LAFTHVTVDPATESIYTIALVILNSSWCVASNYTDESPKDRVVIWISPGDALAPSLNYIQLCDCTVSKEEKNKKKKPREMKQLQWLLLQVVAVQGELYTHTHVRGNNRFRESTR